MNGMTLRKFVQTMADYDEIEFSYADVQYNFQKENASEGLKISIWRAGDKNPCYCVEIADDPAAVKQAAKKLVNAKILFDGKSIAEAENDIDVEFFT